MASSKNQQQEYPFSAKYDLSRLPGRQEKFFNVAVAHATDSDMYQQHGAVFAYNGTVVASGSNQGKRQRFNKQNVCSAHAELSVLWQVVPGTHQIKWYEKGAKVAKGTICAA